MPKQPRLRPNYRADSNFLIRMVHSIGADVRAPPEWRADTIQMLVKLADRLREAPIGQAQETSIQGLQRLQEAVQEVKAETEEIQTKEEFYKETTQEAKEEDIRTEAEK